MDVPYLRCAILMFERSLLAFWYKLYLRWFYTYVLLFCIVFITCVTFYLRSSHVRALYLYQIRIRSMTHGIEVNDIDNFSDVV